MGTVLYITAHPFEEDKSHAIAAGKEFVQAYRQTHPLDEVIHLDLFKAWIPLLDADVFNGWEKLKQGTPFEALNGDEQSKIGRINELVDQFVAADKYVFVSPTWNYSYPPVMKAYLDSICIAGKTFSYLPDIGRVGLLGDKKAIHIQASGSVLSPGSNTLAENWEMGHRHLKVIMEFVGISELAGIFIEGMAEYPDQALQIKEKAIRRAREAAQVF
ncbi:NAD(P)H-dependent oxidoreductase [Paenibacillus sp. IB182496]|uniref:FMN dependent NADH:quinone oxidoreductase n=1 Tax=Paenibacillus sabuli TaxID=2772509 RepID=A0A927GS85_9BACL|nr:NAD(P)H-dependent oxidoreductase [Paenibacillus sabuli]MBD2845447.1 NAD(P)H-dependent oxidoreductase [Paenibacillus sabuli]